MANFKLIPLHLENFFIKSAPEQDTLFAGLPLADKNLLLKVFYEASDDIIWQINDLHAITGPGGEEIAEQ